MRPAVLKRLPTPAVHHPDPDVSVHTLIRYFFAINFHIVLPSTATPPLLRSCQRICPSTGALCASSGSIVSDYGLDDRVIEVLSPTGAENFSSSPCVQTGSGAHPASYPMGTGGSFPGGKARPGRDSDHSPPSSAEVKNE
jgi:hypothetical protein